jgi:hypothetical protein
MDRALAITDLKQSSALHYTHDVDGLDNSMSVSCLTVVYLGPASRLNCTSSNFRRRVLLALDGLDGCIYT